MLTLVSQTKPVLEDNLGLAYSAALEFVQPRRVAVQDTDEYADALHALWRACDRWTEKKGRFSTYAHKCMRNAIINGIRDRESHSVSAVELEESLEASLEIKKDKVQEFLAEINPHDLVESLFAEDPKESEVDKRNKHVLFQRYMKHASWEDLGKEFGVSRNRAYQYGHRAIKLLREKIKDVS